MSLFTYLFSPSGRFRRLDYNFVWMGLGLLNLIGSLLYLILGAELGILELDTRGHLHLNAADMEPITTALAVLSYIWAGMSLIVYQISTLKRFHDLGHSVWFYLSVFIILPVCFFFLMALFIFLKIHAWTFVAIFAAIISLLILIFSIRLTCARGEDFDNIYGTSPYSGDHPVQSRSVAIILFTLLGLSLLLAYPAFLAYTALPVHPVTTQSGFFNVFEQQQEPEKPIVLLRRRAEKGDPAAQYELSFLYTTGQDGAPRDNKETLQWLLKSANHGYPNAQYSLGVFYTTGKGVVPMDNTTAFFWLALAVNGGYDERVEKKFFLEAVAEKLTPEVRATILQRVNNWRPQK